MSGFFAYPLVQSVFIPVLGGFVLTGVIRFLNGKARGPRVASASVGIGFLVGYGLIAGSPALPPNTAVEKLAYLVTAALVLGFLLDFVNVPKAIRWFAFVLGSAAALYWLSGPKIETGGTLTYLTLIVLWFGSLISLWRLEVGGGADLVPSIKLIAVALGLGAVAIFGRAADLGQMAFGLATALGGFMLWNWPKNRYPYGATLLLTAGGGLAAISFTLALYTATSSIALALLLLAMFGDLAAKHVKLGSSGLAKVIQPLVLTGACLIPVLAAIAVAYLQSTLEDAGLG